MMYDDGEYYYSATDVFSTCLGDSMNNSNKKKMMNKKRFSDEQVRSLESIFENETKLEPKKKVEVAKQLGLQPRQVAIWFQNKRARYKSKQLEREYAVLRADYNALASQFEDLKKEKHSLFLQLQKLKHENRGCDSKWEDKKSEKKKETLSMEGSDNGASCILSSSDEGSSENNHENENKKNDYLGVVEELNDDEMLRMNMMEGGGNNTVQQLGVGSCCSLSEWDDYSDPEGLFDQQQKTAVDSCNHWWDFWSN